MIAQRSPSIAIAQPSHARVFDETECWWGEEEQSVVSPSLGLYPFLKAIHFEPTCIHLYTRGS